MASQTQTNAVADSTEGKSNVVKDSEVNSFPDRTISVKTTTADASTPWRKTRTESAGRVSKKGVFYDKRKRTNSMGVQVEDTRICVVMVGLPARGKSLIAQKGMFSSHRIARRRTTFVSSHP